MAPPMVPVPSLRMVLNALRSSASDIALRISALSNGCEPRLTIRLTATPVDLSSHTAFGAWVFMSFISGAETSVGKVRSNSPVVKARMRVERFSMILMSMASRYGLPFLK